MEPPAPSRKAHPVLCRRCCPGGAVTPSREAHPVLCRLSLCCRGRQQARWHGRGKTPPTLGLAPPAHDNRITELLRRSSATTKTMPPKLGPTPPPTTTEQRSCFAAPPPNQNEDEAVRPGPAAAGRGHRPEVRRGFEHEIHRHKTYLILSPPL